MEKVSPNQQPDAVQEDIKKAQSFIEKVKKADYKGLFSGIFGNFYSKYKKFIIIGGISLAVFILLLSVLVMTYGKRGKALRATPAPLTPIPTASDEIKNPSRYATDAGVLKIGDDIKNLDRDLNAVDLKENFLKPPVIEFDESF